jgi:hypothetical protein
MRHTMILVLLLLPMISLSVGCDTESGDTGGRSGEGGSQDVTNPPEDTANPADTASQETQVESCLTGVNCVSDDDCEGGARCNDALSPPACFNLYCGASGDACNQDELCKEGLTCSGGACKEDQDPCVAGECSVECAAIGAFDIDCLPAGAECQEAYAATILQTWKDGEYGDVMSENVLNCDWTPGICDAQFRCRDVHCFCDPDCYIEDSASPGTYLEPPVCAYDGNCDSWCPTGVDPDCAGSDKDGKYCG